MPLREWDVGALRRQFALVSQDVVLFNDTVAANVALGSPPDRDRVIEALRAANLLDFVDGLPQGIDTLIGHNGSQLSGGQRQRLAIARAIYKDAPILILDEATSALDSESERLVQQALETLMSGRTSLVIAHRLSTIERADRIVVLAEGRVVQQGSHAELLEKGGLYAKLHALQFREPTRMNHAISRYPVPPLLDLPEDLRQRILEVQEKAGFVPNVFLGFAHRPDEFRAFFAYHDALMLRRLGALEGREGNDRRRDQRRQPLPLLRGRARRDPARLREEPVHRRSARGQLPAAPTSRRGRRRCWRSR